MFFGLEFENLQMYWWIILSLLGGFLIFMFFVQGGQTLIDTLSANELEKTMLINSLGRKWELGFTTFVLFGGASFAAFPLFYSTSFGGAYWIWLCILFCFIIQAVSYEYRKKQNNFLGSKSYELFLKINGFLGVFLIGIVLSSFFSGSYFRLDENHFVVWEHSLRGLELLLNPYNYFLAFGLVFLSRVLGSAYFMNNIAHTALRARASKAIFVNGILFLLFFVAFLVWIFLKEGFFIDENAKVSLLGFVYWYNFTHNIWLLFLLCIGIVFVGIGLWLGALVKTPCAIWSLGFGVILSVFALLASLGLGKSSFYPSLSHLQSSLYLAKASSSFYTLSIMAYVSLLVPFVLAYIVYVWRAMDRMKITEEEITKSEHIY